MTTAISHLRESKRTDESRMVEKSLGPYFDQVDCYRYNSASLRIRVVDPRFEGLSREHRDGMVEPYLDRLPLETQRDILTFLTIAPSDFQRPPATFKEFMINDEFDDPSPSML